VRAGFAPFNVLNIDGRLLVFSPCKNNPTATTTKSPAATRNFSTAPLRARLSKPAGHSEQVIAEDACSAGSLEEDLRNHQIR
jgi:hypothetical protein